MKTSNLVPLRSIAMIATVGVSWFAPACASKPTGADVPLDATKDCGGGLVTLHYPKSFVAGDPQPGLCTVAPDAASGFGTQTALIVTVVEGNAISLDRAAEVFARAYAEKPGWVAKTSEKKKCFKDNYGAEITGTLTEGKESIDMRICSFVYFGRVVQISTSSAQGRDAELLARLWDAVELHELPLVGGAPAPSAPETKGSR